MKYKTQYAVIIYNDNHEKAYIISTNKKQVENIYNYLLEQRKAGLFLKAFAFGQKCVKVKNLYKI